MKSESIVSGEVMGETEVVLEESPTPIVVEEDDEEEDDEERMLKTPDKKDVEESATLHVDDASDTDNFPDHNNASVHISTPISSITHHSKDEIEVEDKAPVLTLQTHPATRPWHQHPRLTELYLQPDWWTLWIGLLSFDIGILIVFIGVPLLNNQDDTYRVKYAVPQPKAWQSNPLDAWDVYNLVGIPLLLLAFLGLYLMSLWSMGKFKAGAAGEMKEYIQGFVVMAIIAILSMWIGVNEWCNKNGFGYAVFAIVLGMMAGNIPDAFGKADSIGWLLKKAAKDGEYFIKCSLVLLAVELTVLAKVGGPAMIVSWIGSPLAIAGGFYIGTKWLGCKDSLAMLIAVGASWCGASAISAVAPVVMASSEDVALSISVVACFTVIFTFVQPYIAIAVGMPHDVAGAWIGGSVDQTGNVIVSAAIISEEATEVAGIVKMVLNAGMGVMATVISCYWSTRKTTDADGNVVEPPKLRLAYLWDKFPKFTLGFIITSALLTWIISETEGSLEAEALPKAVSTLNKWWFAIAFVGIGLTTNVKKLFREAWASGIIQVYLVANTIDIFLALGLSYLAYTYLE